MAGNRRVQVLASSLSPVYTFLAYGAVLLGVAVLDSLEGGRLAAIGAVMLLLLRSLLSDVLAHEAKLPGQDYLLVDGPLASQLNSIGALFGLIFRAAGK